MVYIFVFIACLSSIIAFSVMALRKSKGNSLSVVFSVLGLVAGFVALSLSAPRNSDQLGFDYLGIIVAILAIFATLLLGLQLYNAFKLKEDADEVHKAKQRIVDYETKMERLTKQSESLQLTLDQLTKQTNIIESEIKSLNDITSDLKEKSKNAVYVSDDDPFYDK